MPTAPKKVFVTVGSTLFQQLTDALLSRDTLAGLARLGVEEVVVQVGKGEIPAHIADVQSVSAGAGGASASAARGEGGARGTNVAAFQLDSLSVKVFRYTRDAAEMERWVGWADAVVSHAGSGTILQVLRHDPAPRLLVVPNPALMDNHQQELADAMSAGGYVVAGNVGDLYTGLKQLCDPNYSAVPFPGFQPKRFQSILDEVAGFV